MGILRETLRDRCRIAQRIRKSFVKKHSNLDLAFLTKPFRTLAWYSLLAFLVLFLGFFWIFFKLFKRDEDSAENSTAFKITVLSFWLNFVLLSAYYGGGLTTDLTVNNGKVHFESYSEVISDFSFHYRTFAYFNF